MRIAAMIVLGGMVVSVHVGRFLPRPLAEHEITDAVERTDGIWELLRRALTESELTTKQRSELFSILDTVRDQGYTNASAFICTNDSTLCAWAGKEVELIADHWGRGTWISTFSGRTHIVRSGRIGFFRTTTALPVPVQAPIDTVVSVGYPDGVSWLIAQPTLPAGKGIVTVLLGILISLQFMEYQNRRDFLRAMATVIGGRTAFLVAAPSGGLFSPELFASEFPLVGSTGDMLLTSVSLLFLSFLIPTAGEAHGRRTTWATAAQVGGALLLGMGSCLVVSSLVSRATIPSLPLRRLSLSPFVVVFVASFAVLFGAFARCLAAVPRPPARVSFVAGILLGIIGIAGGEVFTIAGALLISTTVLVAGSMWSVGRIALLAVLAAGVFLIAVTGPQLAGLRKAQAELFAGELSRTHEPWFTLVVEEALQQGVHDQAPLPDVWKSGPLGALPVVGELALLNGKGTVVERFSFGMRRQTYADMPNLAGVESIHLWSDVFEYGASPLMVIRGLAPLDAGKIGENRYLVLTAVADIVSPVLLHGVPLLADGTTWPLMLRFIDHGLISEIEPGRLAPGWRTDEASDADAFTFQREFADGPHFVSLLVLEDPISERIAAGLVIFGLLCLAAQVAIGLKNLWLSPSMERLLYRYRDRLLPLLLALGAGPVAVLLILGPVLEREVQQKQLSQEAQERAKEVATTLRESMLQQAALYAGYAGLETQPPNQRDAREQIWVFDEGGRASEQELKPDAQLSSALIRAAIEWSRSMFIIGSDGKAAFSVVPDRSGALTLRRPLDRVLEDAQGEHERWSLGAWHRGMLVAASVVPPCSTVPRFLPSQAMHPGEPVLQSHTLPGGWTFQTLSDDLREAALAIGVRKEEQSDAVTAWESTELWVLAVFLPLLAVTILVSSAAARLVSRPVSQLTARALLVRQEQQYEPWPRLSGEVGELGNALEEMTRSLIKSRRDIEERRAYLEVVLSHITSCVVVVGRDGVVSLYNAAAKPLLSSLTIPTGEESVSVTGGALESVVNAVLSTGRSAHDSLRIDIKGDERLWRIAAAPLTRGQGEEPFAAVVVLEEMTDFAEEQRLVAWTEFAREVAHEIKNPLTPIKLAVQHLRRAYEEQRSGYASVLDRATTMIERQAAKMEEIVKEFSSFARATGREFTSIEIGELVEECISDYRYVEAKGIDIVFERSEEVLVHGDREALRRVFANLLDNAIRALDKTGGAIRATVMRRGERAQIVFDDTGRGVPPEAVSRLFEPGFSLRRGGTGMGLAICKSLINAHGGTIELDNRSEGGIRVVVALPLLVGPE